MTFYTDKKEGMSPSSIAMWFGAKSSFIKYYFKVEKMFETESMRTGTKVHRLIEAGLLKVKCNYEFSEKDISCTISPGMIFRGRPDSHGIYGERAMFVDYKTGKQSDWKKKLPSDIKMRATAFLVWMDTGKPSEVKGMIEFIQTKQEGKSVVPIEDKETEVYEVTYTSKEMEEFAGVIKREMENVNKFYPKWEDRPDGFVSNANVEEFIVLDQKIRELEVQKEDIKETIKELMEFGGEENHATPYGTFYLTSKKKYEYPSDMTFRVDERDFSIEEAQDIANGAKGAKKNYELTNEPVDTVTSIGFRSKKS